MLESLAFRRAVDARKRTHPRVHAFLGGRLDLRESARLRPLLDRFGSCLFDFLEQTLEDMMALAEPVGLSAGGDVSAFLDALHRETGALPHEARFDSFEAVVERFYSKPIYPLLEHAMFLHPIGLERLAQVLELLPPRPARFIADLGAGPAAILCALLERWPDATANAFDVSMPCRDYAEALVRRRGLEPRVSLTCADARRLPALGGPFDLVLATEVIEHVPDPEALVEAIRQSLSPGGHLIGSAPLELPWGAHLAHFRAENDIRGLFTEGFEEEAWRRVPLGAGAALCFFRFRRAAGAEPRGVARG